MQKCNSDKKCKHAIRIKNAKMQLSNEHILRQLAFKAYLSAYGSANIHPWQRHRSLYLHNACRTLLKLALHPALNFVHVSLLIWNIWQYHSTMYCMYTYFKQYAHISHCTMQWSRKTWILVYNQWLFIVELSCILETWASKLVK